ncbi:MAG: nuclear transport factor 2 family protein [Myxococcota bacterium]|nr:nuclear transport factor 2 family protein [Myxococcota bacterium]
MSEIERSARLAREWMRAFNAYDVDALVALYHPDATHTSPKIRALHPDTGGRLVGREAIAAWWRGAIGRTPGLRYEETALTASAERVVLEYVRHADGEPPMPVAEAFDVESGRVRASRVFHG